MAPNSIRDKFGDDYWADEHTFVMGIDRRFTIHIARRFKSRTVLETCTGAGFTTISLAGVSKHVITVEIDPNHQRQAVHNVEKAGLSDRVTFIRGDILNPLLLKKLPPVEAVFIDPDWAVTGPAHVYRFKDSNMRPPADALLDTILKLTGNAAVVLPPALDTQELDGLPGHELERLYLGESHELYCLYFGDLMTAPGETEFRVSG